jgi:hypothetical protein
MFLKRFEAIEIPIPSGSTNTRFYFPDAPQLRSAFINCIQVYGPGAITATPNTLSTPATNVEMKKATLTLYSGDIQLVFNMPLLAYNNVVGYDTTSTQNNPYVFQLPDLQGLIISWTKSYITLSSAAATTNVAFSFGVYYTLPE